MHDKGEVSLIEASPWINPLFTVQKRVEREREMGIGWRMEKSKRSNLPVERGMSKKFFLGIYGVHPLGPRERERELMTVLA